MRHEDFRAALEAGDIRLLRRMWSSWFPHLPQPKTAEEAEGVMHYARTQAETINFKVRAYSHRWLTERNLPSALPDRLRPSAERVYSKIVGGVGISINTKNKFLKPAMIEVRKAMEDVVSHAYANGDTDPALVSRLMNEAREREMQKLFGR